MMAPSVSTPSTATILIVDDTPATLRVLCDHLEENGFKTVVAIDGQEALERARFVKPDLVLLDVMMPVQDGFETCRRMKADPNLREIPVVFMTSLSQTENKLAGFEAGGVDYVTKPLQLDEVLARIRNHITLRTLQAQLAARNEQLQHEVQERTRAQEALREANALLERRVLERTAQLAQLNRNLEAGIAERIRIEDTLRASEERYRALFEDNPAMYFTLDASGGVLSVNGFGASQLGYAVEELVGRSVLEVFHPEDQASVQRHMAICLSQPGLAHGWELRKVRKDGSVLWVKELARAVPQPEGDPLVLVVCEDITAKVALEAQFRQAQKMEAFGQLAGGVAHDFNNILTVVLSASDWASLPQVTTEERLEALGEIRDAARRAANLTRQLLVFSQRHTLNPQTLDLNQVITDLGRMLSRLIGEHISLRFELSAQPATVHADAAMLEQVLVNLAVNARDAMPGGGSLLVRTSIAQVSVTTVARTPKSRPGTFVRLDIVDTGTGIAPELLARIFEPFFTTKESGKGSGLGLATSLGIVEQHAGWIDVASTPGQGTEISVFLPFRDETASRPVPHVGSAPGGSETILLVEDESSVRRATEHALQRGGYRVLEAASGEEALGVWRQHRAAIQLVLTDILMPGGTSGRSLADRLLVENPGLKIGFISGYDPDTLGAQAPGKATPVLAKPFSREALLTYVRERLDS